MGGATHALSCTQSGKSALCFNNRFLLHSIASVSPKDFFKRAVDWGEARSLLSKALISRARASKHRFKVPTYFCVLQAFPDRPGHTAAKPGDARLLLHHPIKEANPPAPAPREAAPVQFALRPSPTSCASQCGIQQPAVRSRGGRLIVLPDISVSSQGADATHPVGLSVCEALHLPIKAVAPVADKLVVLGPVQVRAQCLRL